MTVSEYMCTVSACVAALVIWDMIQEFTRWSWLRWKEKKEKWNE